MKKENDEIKSNHESLNNKVELLKNENENLIFQHENINNLNKKILEI